MSVRLFYVDESFDSAKFCLSAIAIRHGDWRDCFARVRQHRVLLKKDHGLLIRKEIHATEFVAGRGRITAPGRIIGKHDRVRIFESMLRLVAQLPRVTVFNVCLEQKDHRNAQLAAWDRLINRIERTMLSFEEQEYPLRRRLAANLPPSVADQDRRMIEERLAAFRPRAMIFADKGRELEITRAVRKMAIFNPIPSAVGTWDDGEAVRNIPVERLIEDPVFKDSHQSYFIQLADCVAFALLKREVAPTPHVRKYGIDRLFDKNVTGVCFKKASRDDPFGIVRR